VKKDKFENSGDAESESDNDEDLFKGGDVNVAGEEKK